MIQGFPCGSAGKETACNVGDLGSILGWEDPWRMERLPTPIFWPREFHGLYSLWGCKESDTTEKLSLSYYYMEKEMATHSNILARESPWTRGDWWATVHGVTKESDMT